MKKIILLVTLCAFLSGCSSDSKTITEENLTDHSTVTSPAMHHETEIISEKQFIDEMIPHHEEAVESSKELLTTTTNEELKNFAQRVITAQEKEISQMKQWHMAWFKQEYVQSVYTPMMSDLSQLSDAEKDSAYIVGMLEHHKGAVTIAEQLLALNPRPELQTLGEAIIEDQSREITELEKMMNPAEQ